jgi:hypothetical protein
VNAGDGTFADIAKQLLVRGTAAKGDWGRPIAYTRQFESNFFVRAGAEIRDTYNSMLAEARSREGEPSDFLKMTELRYGHIPDFKDAKIPSWTEASMTPELLDEWRRIVSSRESRFRRAWGQVMLAPNTSVRVNPSSTVKVAGFVNSDTHYSTFKKIYSGL